MCQKLVTIAASLKWSRKGRIYHAHPYAYLSWKFGKDRSSTLWDNRWARSWSLRALRLESNRGPLVHIFIYSRFFGGENVKDYITYVKRPFIPGQTFKLSTKASDSKNFIGPKISGPKVVLVLLCKLSLYRAVRAPMEAPALSLTSLMDDPALDNCLQGNC